MNNKSKNITDMPYAQWLEQTLRDISVLPTRGIVVAAALEYGETYANYYKMTMADKIMVSGVIQQDAMFDALTAQGVIEYVDDEEENE